MGSFAQFARFHRETVEPSRSPDYGDSVSQNRRRLSRERDCVGCDAAGSAESRACEGWLQRDCSGLLSRIYPQRIRGAENRALRENLVSDSQAYRDQPEATAGGGERVSRRAGMKQLIGERLALQHR